MAERINVLREVRRGVCEILDAETFLRWIDLEEDPFGVYAPGDMGLTEGILPPGDQAVMVSVYDVAQGQVPVVGVQFHIAALDEDLVTLAAQAISDTLEGRYGGNIGPVRLVRAAYQSTGLLGQDANGRQARTENYYLTIHRSIPHREGE